MMWSLLVRVWTTSAAQELFGREDFGRVHPRHRVSIAAARRVITRARDIRIAPITMKTVQPKFLGQQRHTECDSGKVAEAKSTT
jgi:hypothetical protein